MEEDKIESFFKGMKKADERLIIPPFPGRKETRRLQPSFLYAAAAIAAVLVTVVYLVQPAGHESAGQDEIVIGQDALTTRSLIDAPEESLSEWESPTDYLSEDF